MCSVEIYFSFLCVYDFSEFARTDENLINSVSLLNTVQQVIQSVFHFDPISSQLN